jgi:hypothetical protein
MTSNDLREFCRALDVEWPCTLAALDDARKLQVQVWHPDKHQNNDRLRKAGEEKLKRINLAYEKLKAYLQRGAPRCGSCEEPTAEPGDLCASCRAKRARRDQEALEEMQRRESAPKFSDITGRWTFPGFMGMNARFEFSGRGPRFKLAGFGPLGQTDEGVADVDGTRVEIQGRNILAGTYSGILTVEGNRMSGVLTLLGIPTPIQLWRG